MKKALVGATLALCLAPAIAEARGFKVKIRMPGSSAPVAAKAAVVPAAAASGAPRGIYIVPIPRSTGSASSQQSQSAAEKPATTPQAPAAPATVVAAARPQAAPPDAPASKPPPPVIKSWQVPTFGTSLANAPRRDVPGFQDAY